MIVGYEPVGEEVIGGSPHRMAGPVGVGVGHGLLSSRHAKLGFVLLNKQ
jgi:hypothetical protein